MVKYSSDKWTNISLQENYTASPNIFGTIQNTFDKDPAALRQRNLTTNAFDIQIEEENSISQDLSHLNTPVALLSIENNVALTDKDGNVFGETGTVAVNSSWQTITAQNTYYNPIVIAGIPTHQEDAPGIVRVKNVSANSFAIRFQEWNAEDGVHAAEQISYMIIEGSIPSVSYTHLTLPTTPYV